MTRLYVQKTVRMEPSTADSVERLIAKRKIKGGDRPDTFSGICEEALLTLLSRQKKRRKR